MRQPSLFDDPGPTKAEPIAAPPPTVESWEGHDCPRCKHYTESTGRDRMPGFGICSHMGTPVNGRVVAWEYVSTGPYSACRFTPSRLELI